jgi:hypothetical protein
VRCSMTKDQQKWCTKPPVQGDAYGLFLKKKMRRSWSCL